MKKVFHYCWPECLLFHGNNCITEDAIADMQAQKQQAEAGLAQTQANIDSLQKKQSWRTICLI
ncbi:MAG: hypothetical protein ACLRTI_11975 [Blautia sp.]